MLRLGVPSLRKASSLVRSAAPARLASRGYHENVLDHYNNPRNVGAFNKSDPDVGTGLVGAPACGDVMKLQIRVDANGNITESCFKTFGCGSAIASSSVGKLPRCVNFVWSLSPTCFHFHSFQPCFFCAHN